MEFRCSIRQLIRLSLAVGLLVAFLAPGPAQAQEPPGSQGLWQTFTTANSGLRGNWVTALLEDRAGGLWVGTWRGVSRYFEGTWQTFSTEDGSLGRDFVTALLEDRAGGVWVGTDGGVSRYFEGTWQTFTTESGSLGSNDVTALLEDRAGGMWVGTGGGVSRYFQGIWQTFSVESGSLGHNRVTALLEDRAGGVWVGTSDTFGEGGGVSRYFEGTWQTFSAETGSLGSNQVTAILEDRAGRLWISTSPKWDGEKFIGGGVSYYSEGTWQTFSVESGSLGDNDVTALLEDRAGGLWVGTRGGGVSRYFQGTWQTFSVESGSLSYNDVTTLLEDQAGGLWVGTGGWLYNEESLLLTEGGGVSRYFQGIWQTFSVESGSLGGNTVIALLEDRAGRVWVGTYRGGVSRYFEGNWQTFSAESGSLGYNDVTTLLEDQAGGLWVGTFGGVSHYSEGTWQTFSTEDGSLGRDFVTALLEDRAGGVWVGTDGGVSRYFEGTWQTFTTESGSLGSNDVTALLEDRAGGVWVGTYGGGVSRYFKGTWQTFSKESGSLGDNNVWALLEDRGGGLWVGTEGGGASRYFQGGWQTFTMEGGSLGHNDVTPLLEDQAGGLWVGTKGGVSRYFEGTWRTFSVESGSLGANRVGVLLEDQAGGVWVGTLGGGVSRYFEGAWQTFSVESGSLVDNHVIALLEDRAGRVWVGTYCGGVSRSRLGSHRPWVLPRKLEVERGGKVQSYDLSGGDVPEVSLDFPVERLTIRFVGADLDSHPSNIRYFYQLEGQDAKKRPTAEGVAQYTNLPPGRYTFIVQSLDENLTFSPEARLSIVIPAPFWRTAWFWGGVALAVVGAVATGRRWRRVQKLRRGFNPYKPGPPILEPKLFFGRQKTMQTILDGLREVHFAVYGPRRIGKTSLLRQLERRLPELAYPTDLFVPVFVQLQRVPEAELFRRLIRLVAEAARPHTGFLSLVADDKETGYDDMDFTDDLETIAEAVRQRRGKEARLILLLDEGEQLNEYSRDTQKRWRGVLMDAVGQEHLRLVWSGLGITPIKDDTSPWYNLFAPPIHLAPLDRETAARLITEPVKGIYQYDEAAIALILEQSGGRPYEIQSLCYAVIEHVKHRIQGQKVSPPVQVTADDVKAVAQQPGQVPAVETQYETPSLSRQVAESQSEYHADDGDDE